MRHKLMRGHGIGTFEKGDAKRLQEWGKQGWLLKRSYLFLNFYLLETGEPEDLEYFLAFPKGDLAEWEKAVGEEGFQVVQRLPGRMRILKGEGYLFSMQRGQIDALQQAMVLGLTTVVYGLLLGLCYWAVQNLDGPLIVFPIIFLFYGIWYFILYFFLFLQKGIQALIHKIRGD